MNTMLNPGGLMNIFANANSYYDTVFKRRSVRKYSTSKVMTLQDAEAVLELCKEIIPLCPEIKTEFRLMRREELSVKFGHYCILMYSEKKDNCYVNAGYMLEQLELQLEANGIGVCWYGLASPKEKVTEDGLEFMIMLTFGIADGDFLRTNASDFSRKSCEQIWLGEDRYGVSGAVRLAPSACNSQPWMFESSGDIIRVSRKTDVRTIIPRAFRKRFNSIDIGIALCIFEITLLAKRIDFERSVLSESSASDENNLIAIAEYSLKKETKK